MSKPRGDAGAQEAVKARGDAGAPAALTAIAEHEVYCRAEKDISRDAWKKAQVNLAANPDDEILLQIERRTHNQYLDELEIWDDATKKLALYDKQVAPSAREGEKISKADAESFLTAAARHLRVGLEQGIVSVSQDAMQCATPEAFYSMASDQLRGAFGEAMNTAVRESRLPPWCSAAIISGL